ncbi:DUF3081 family protein [Vibrio sp. T187]|uniref:DUF3081 family protein n=1 Tax=Vibrio TaxID=662 RepID=UPI0010C955D7|nr:MULTISPECIES: DUF3081 family protein [Vibrio]MBW3695152.1 DUF3081 family protein [Vibrio sp. T187]
MSYKIDPSDIMHAYDLVMERGTPTESGKVYDGVEARLDCGDYEVYLRGYGAQVKMRGHHSYHVDFSEQALRDEFLRKVACIAK